MSNGNDGIPRMTVGVDLGDRHHYIVVLDRAAEVVKAIRITNSAAQIRKFFSKLAPCRVALETGTHANWVNSLIKSLGHEVIVANSRRVRLISQNKNKSDRVDAETLARLARADVKLLAPVNVRAEPVRVDWTLLKGREALVECRTKLVNHCRCSVKSGTGSRLPACSTASFHRKAWLEVPKEMREVLAATFGMVGELSRQIDEMDQQIEEKCEKVYPQTKLMRQIKGVGPITALAFALRVESPGRFKKSRDVGPFFGLTRKRDQSGDYDPQLRISKQGDRMIRCLLVSCAHYILGHLGPDCDLRRHGQRIEARGGKTAKKVAVVAVARKLAVLMHVLWVTGAKYEPLHNAELASAA